MKTKRGKISSPFPWSSDPMSRQMFESIYWLSKDLRPLFLRLVVGVAEKVRNEQKQSKITVTLGPERLQLLYQYMARQKETNNLSEDLEKALIAFYSLNEMGQAAVCFLITNIIRLVERYLDVYRRLEIYQNRENRNADIKHLVCFALNKGVEDGEAELERLVGKDLMQAYYQKIAS